MSSTQLDSRGPLALTQGRADAALAGQTLVGRYDMLELLGMRRRFRRRRPERVRSL